MTPWQKAKQWQDTHDTQDFWELLGEHLSAGYVWNSPKVFMLASEARWNAEEQTFERRSQLLVRSLGCFCWPRKCCWGVSARGAEAAPICRLVPAQPI
jgi:hypothetical protein